LLFTASLASRVTEDFPNLVSERRTAGTVICAMAPRTAGLNTRAQADAVAAAHGLQGLGEGWLEISEYDAQSIATLVLHRDLAQGTAIMPQADASALAASFLELVPPPQRYFTNGDWADVMGEGGEAPESVGFDPLSNAAIDAGIVCVGEEITAILWVQDEA